MNYNKCSRVTRVNARTCTRLGQLITIFYINHHSNALYIHRIFKD